MLSGFININKKSGFSSNKALSILKYNLKQNNIITKVGHFGTLDPIAEGVLPVALGRATRLFDYSLDKTKEYIARFVFGVETDTLDGTGKVIKTENKPIKVEDIMTAIPHLIGEIEQMPPAYSAKSIGGVRAYRLAREGKEVILHPKKIIINSIELLRQVNENQFEFKISCGGGTYIRSIVRDMADLMGTCGYMSALRRTASGIFTLESACDLDDLSDIEEKILPITFFTDLFKRYELSDREFSTIKNGVPTSVGFNYELPLAVYYCGELLGIGTVSNEKLIIKTWLI